MRDTTTTINDIHREKLYATARHEILTHGKLGLLRPSEGELTELRNTTRVDSSRDSLENVHKFSVIPDSAIDLDDYKALFDNKR